MRIIIYILLILSSSCISDKDKKLSDSLNLAKNNRKELEKVLEHFKNDSLKLEAAKFLIINIPGNGSYDSSKLDKYRPLLYKLDSLRQKVEDEEAIFKAIDSEWDIFIQDNSPTIDIYSQITHDIHVISSNYLIDNINKSFDAWQKTLFKDSIDFNTYLHYILPYRKYNGYVLENWRDYFLSQYGQYINKYHSPRETVDSLQNLVLDYQVNWSKISNYPYICLSDYNLSKTSKCIDKCWFNSILLASLGIPCAIDFVPAWGNRNYGHSWNSIIINGKTYPFEATGGSGMWKNKLVYNNTWIDKYWMKSRLPKVFRNTFVSIDEGPASDKQRNEKNTPACFLNSKYMDVSDEYFITSDIHIKIKDKTLSKEHKYAYLCVFNENVWKPVYWGEVKSSEVCFKKMGRDIVYLPVFYKDGKIIPFNDVFILKEDGSIDYLIPDKKEKMKVYMERKYYARPDISFWTEWNAGAYFEVADNRMFDRAKKVLTVGDCESRPNTWMLKKPVTTQYIRYLFPEKKDVLAELCFYKKNNLDKLELIKGEITMFDAKAEDEMKKIFDGDILTFANLNKFQTNNEIKNNIWVGMDFGKRVEIEAIGLCPRNDENNVIKGYEYELFYWSKQWISLGKKVATDYNITYDNVPANALLLLKCTTKGIENRIFTWKTDSLIWQ